MRLAVPLVNVEDVQPLIWSGADEFYCGLKTNKSRHPFFANLNRRSLNENNFCDVNQLKKAVAIAHYYHTPVFLTLNEQFTKVQYPYIKEMLDIAAQCQVDGLILSDFALLLHLYQQNLHQKFKITIGTGAINFNWAKINLLNQYGAQRVIFSRKLFPGEMIALQAKIKKSPLESEAFMEGKGYCPNLDGLCYFLHNKGSIGRYGSCTPTVQLGYQCLHQPAMNQHIKRILFSNCKLCFLYDLIKIGVTVIKLLGREDQGKTVIKKVKLTRKIIRKAKSCLTKTEFVTFMTEDLLKYQFDFEENKLIDCHKNVCYFKETFI